MLRLQGVSSSIAPFKKKLVNAPFQKVGPLPFYSTRKLHIKYKKNPSEIARRCEGWLQIRTSRNMPLEIYVQLVAVLHVTL